jgi:hypothetical protein
MTRFETAGKIMEAMGQPVSLYDENPYAIGLGALVVSLIDDEEPQPSVVQVGYYVPKAVDGQNAWLLIRASGEAWVIYDKIDESENRAFPAAFPLRPRADDEVEIVVDAQPNVTFARANGSRIVYAWKSIGAFERDNDGIRSLFRAWVPDH